MLPLNIFAYSNNGNVNTVESRSYWMEILRTDGMAQYNYKVSITIYIICVLYEITKETKAEVHETKGRSGGIGLILCIKLCQIYYNVGLYRLV